MIMNPVSGNLVDRLASRRIRGRAATTIIASRALLIPTVNEYGSRTRIPWHSLNVLSELIQPNSPL